MTKASALAVLRRVSARIGSGAEPELAEIAQARDDVLARYQPVFSTEGVRELAAEDFKSFLLYKNNRHWLAIHRQGNQIVADMDLLRHALTILLDESQPIEDRLRKLRPRNGQPMIKGLARSVITPILMVAYPHKYGVLNRVAESAMKELGLWPDLDRGSDFADRYLAVNAVLQQVAKDLDVDLWTLDALWWGVGQIEEETADVPPTPWVEGDPTVRFGLEKHLHEFLHDNWQGTELGRDWELLEEDGEIVGFKYNTGAVGEIDLLAKHVSEPRWLVVELKRGRTSDYAVGQALRYRGWVRRHLADSTDSVEALVISHEADDKLLYALDGVEGVSALTYSVSFSLAEPRNPWLPATTA